MVFLFVSSLLLLTHPLYCDVKKITSGNKSTDFQKETTQGNHATKQSN